MSVLSPRNKNHIPTMIRGSVLVSSISPITVSQFPPARSHPMYWGIYKYVPSFSPALELA